MALAQSQPANYTPPQLARHYGVSVDKVIRWILAGELQALNLATTTGGRPRYRITAEAVEQFEARRAVVAPPPRQRRRKANLNSGQFY